MKRIAAVAAGVVIAAGIAFFAFRSRFGVRTPARDIILVTIDTTRADALGYAGNADVKTPFIDGLASRGVVFTNAHAHCVVTLASHVSILTGLYPYQHGVHDNAGFVLDPKHLTVASRLKQAGYATGAFVGAYPLDSRFGLNHGFDTYDDNYGKGQASVDFVEQERRAETVLAAATQWWNGQTNQKRFLWVHLYDPHAPYLPPEPFLSQYRSNEYLGEIAYVDDSLSKALGPILAADPDALVIVTADHGEALGEHGEQTHGLFAYEATLKIPLIVARQGVAHRVEAAYVRHVDVVPTILDAAGIATAKDLPGQSLLGKVQASDSYFEALSASFNRGWAPLTGVIHEGMKYIQLPIPELYSLPTDPKELTNLADSRRRDVEMARSLLATMHATSTEPRRAVSEEEAARLRSLGYIASAAPSKSDYTPADDPKALIGVDGKMHDAIDAFEHHNPARGLQLAREIVAERPNMIAGREILAFMLQQNDLVGDAMAQLETIVREPSSPVSDRVQLALLECETNHAEAAVELLSPIANGKDPDVLNAYGVALSNMGRAPEARAQFERILSFDANNAPALQNLGILSLREDDVRGAMTYLNRALELNPRLPLALNTLGVAYARQNDLAHAVDAWNRAVQIDPRQYDALLNIGIVEAKAGNAADARDALARFIRTAPRSQYAADIAQAERLLASLR